MSNITARLIKTDNSVVEISLSAGFANFMSYKVRLCDEDGGKREVIADGSNTDDILDRHRIGNSIDQLDKHILYWNIGLAAFHGGPGRYSAMVSITQDGKEIIGGRHEWEGQLVDGVKLLTGQVRFVVEDKNT